MRISIIGLVICLATCCKLRNQSSQNMKKSFKSRIMAGLYYFGLNCIKCLEDVQEIQLTQLMSLQIIQKSDQNSQIQIFNIEQMNTMLCQFNQIISLK
ncbi:unnamed protein product [Paramecium sonneborni]|uniref:Transmembrane protein n=1 Tax=Paramecium sonneborni TaxID=65129 RepID=A0A8S1RG27_9CILI|nr:unnamed protein product [Paramecium sonneborni]